MPSWKELKNISKYLQKKGDLKQALYEEKTRKETREETLTKVSSKLEAKALLKL